jgi:hypothetical protein
MSSNRYGSVECNDKGALLDGVQALFGKVGTISSTDTSISVRLPGTDRAVSLTSSGGKWNITWDSYDERKIRSAAGAKAGTIDGLIGQAAMESVVTNAAKAKKWKLQKKVDNKGVVELRLKRKAF